MITLTFAAAAIGLMIRAVWTSKYLQAFVALVCLLGFYVCIIGLVLIHHDDPWLGVLIVAMGLAALLAAAWIATRLDAHAERIARRRYRNDADAQ